MKSSSKYLKSWFDYISLFYYLHFKPNGECIAFLIVCYFYINFNVRSIVVCGEKEKERGTTASEWSEEKERR